MIGLSIDNITRIRSRARFMEYIKDQEILTLEEKPRSVLFVCSWAYGCRHEDRLGELV